MKNSFSRYRGFVAKAAGAFLAGGLASAAIAAGAAGYPSLEHAGTVVLAAAVVVSSLAARRAKTARAALDAIEATCKRIAEGDFEARITGVDHGSACAGAQDAVNDAIDRCDAFVREATASLDAVCRGVYYRLILREGLNGAFRIAAESINASVQANGRAVAEARKEAEAEKNFVVQTIGAGLARLAAKDLSARIGDELPAAYARVRDDFNATVDAIESAMRHVRSSADAIASGAAEIATASSDFARRTEVQAANLEASTAAVREVSDGVDATAQSSGATQDHISAAKSDADASIEVVEKTIAAVTGIAESSKKIAAAVGVIDEIAFQTNLLALNASVEAARAGEAGRGFAVVASEVRALAQRSAQAAKEIKVLIAQASASVETGADAMTETAAAFNRIKEQISMVDGGIAEIAAKARDHSTTLKEASLAIGDIDQATQQNAAMAEEATASMQVPGRRERTAHAHGRGVRAERRHPRQIVRRGPRSFERSEGGLNPLPFRTSLFAVSGAFKAETLRRLPPLRRRQAPWPASRRKRRAAIRDASALSENCRRRRCASVGDRPSRILPPVSRRSIPPRREVGIEDVSRGVGLDAPG